MITTIKLLNNILKGNVVFVGGVSLHYLGLKDSIRDIDIVVSTEHIKLLESKININYFDNRESVLNQVGVMRATATLNNINIDLFIHENHIETNIVNIDECKIKIASLANHIKHYKMLDKKVKDKNMNVTRYSDMVKTLTEHYCGILKI